MKKKVFSAKRQKVEFDYEFMNGSKISLVVVSLSSKEQAEVTELRTTDSDSFVDNFKIVLSKQLAENDKDEVEKVIEEQYENADLIEFSNSLAALIKEEKAKK